ncbi:hypothetical protein P879_00610 [Paragonimus westermani]|uniref:Uncharacterized protein n=1 Tax=Paragonimus westermani TaxID=34504 RepID=A0A8T0DWZ4_9TREM|nr:hypothetical protein P879_00610 [Paragonimus westermani]
MVRLILRGIFAVLMLRTVVFASSRSLSSQILASVKCPSPNALWRFNHEQLAHLVSKDLIVTPEFISMEEEKNLIDELDTHLLKHRYQNAHWDYYCGGSVVVISLLSDSVLRMSVPPVEELVALPEDQPDLRSIALPGTDSWIDIRIPRRSVYVMRGGTRYLLAHAILSNAQVARLYEEHPISLYDVQRARRISVICRSKIRAKMIPYGEAPSEESAPFEPKPLE